MATLADVLAYQRPDVISNWRGPNVQSWWNQYGVNELRNRLRQLGRTDVLNSPYTQSPSGLMQWYLKEGQKEYGDIWTAGKTGAAKPASTTPTQTKAQQYSSTAAEQGKKVAEIPPFAEMLPFYKGWERLQPSARAAAVSQVNPEYQRQYQQQMQDYMMGMASAGGGRFGKGWGGAGALGADIERQRKGSIQDYLNAYRSGYQELFYDPAEQAWSKAMTQGKMGEVPKIPSWGEFAQQYGQGTPTSPTGGDTGAIYGQYIQRPRTTLVGADKGGYRGLY